MRGAKWETTEAQEVKRRKAAEKFLGINFPTQNINALAKNSGLDEKAIEAKRKIFLDDFNTNLTNFAQRYLNARKDNTQEADKMKSRADNKAKTATLMFGGGGGITGKLETTFHKEINNILSAIDNNQNTKNIIVDYIKNLDKDLNKKNLEQIMLELKIKKPAEIIAEPPKKQPEPTKKTPFTPPTPPALTNLASVLKEMVEGKKTIETTTPPGKKSEEVKKEEEKKPEEIKKVEEKKPEEIKKEEKVLTEAEELTALEEEAKGDIPLVPEKKKRLTELKKKLGAPAGEKKEEEGVKKPTLLEVKQFEALLGDLENYYALEEKDKKVEKTKKKYEADNEKLKNSLPAGKVPKAFKKAINEYKKIVEEGFTGAKPDLTKQAARVRVIYDINNLDTSLITKKEATKFDGLLATLIGIEAL